MFPRTGEIYADRGEAGRRLGVIVRSYLRDQRLGGRPVVLGVPRGGLPVAAEVADAVGGDLDITVARKIGLPGQPEYGIGAVAARGKPLFDERSLRLLGLNASDLAASAADERAEADRRLSRYRGDRPTPELNGRLVIVVDDGLATGVTARAVVAAVREQRPKYLIFAAPVCAPDSVALLAREVDAVLCDQQPADFGAVGAWYDNFSQLSDSDVDQILSRAWALHSQEPSIHREKR